MIGLEYLLIWAIFGAIWAGYLFYKFKQSKINNEMFVYKSGASSPYWIPMIIISVIIFPVSMIISLKQGFLKEDIEKLRK